LLDASLDEAPAFLLTFGSDDLQARLSPLASAARPRGPEQLDLLAQ